MDVEPVEYWNAQAKGYDQKIFSTIDEDVSGNILATLDRYGNTDDGQAGTCVDLGCGAGKYLPALAARFGKVVAYDLSPRLVALARANADKHRCRNVRVRSRDLSQVWYREVPLEPALQSREENSDTGPEDDVPGSFSFAVMANVLISPGPESLHVGMLRNAWRALCPGGRLLVLVPSLESALYVRMRCDEANFDGPYGSKSAKAQPSVGDLLQGVFKRVGVRTKHFLEPEFRLLATRAGFDAVEACEKVTFAWKSELDLNYDHEVPLVIRTPPLPWDWLFVLRKPGGQDGIPATTAVHCVGAREPPSTGQRQPTPPPRSHPSSGSSSCTGRPDSRPGTPGRRLPGMLSP